MPQFISSPAEIAAAGNKPKLIQEFVGRIRTQTTDVSVAMMTSPAGWHEPGQRPAFREVTVVISGLLRVEFEGGSQDVTPGQAVVAEPGEWIRYSTPAAGGATYVAICTPAFCPASVNRED